MSEPTDLPTCPADQEGCGNIIPFQDECLCEQCGVLLCSDCWEKPETHNVCKQASAMALEHFQETHDEDGEPLPE